MPIEQALLEAVRGTVTAPAGCGKTHAIAAALRQQQTKRPTLVLTHTNAGVSALRQRFQRLRVATQSYRVSTIDGFAKRMAGMFRQRSGIDPRSLDLLNPGADYPAIQNAAIHLLEAHHLDDALAATYGRLIVDEYQDCSLAQHRIVMALSTALPTCVLGDPMQAIFGFANRLVNWQTDVLANYPSIGELDVPHRWINAQAEDLGRWLLEVRRILEAGGKIDVRTLPARVEYVPTAPGQDDLRRQTAIRSRSVTREGSVLLIGDARNVGGRHLLASQTPGATVVETVDLRDLSIRPRLYRRGRSRDGATAELLLYVDDKPFGRKHPRPFELSAFRTCQKSCYGYRGSASCV
jgi:AAA domain